MALKCPKCGHTKFREIEDEESQNTQLVLRRTRVCRQCGAGLPGSSRSTNGWLEIIVGLVGLGFCIHELIVRPGVPNYIVYGLGVLAFCGLILDGVRRVRSLRIDEELV